MFCSNCGHSLTPQVRFCTACGTKVTVTAKTPTGKVGQKRGQNTRRFPIQKHRLDDLLDQFLKWLGYQQFKYQQLPTENNGVLVQIAKNGGWRKLVGMNTTLNVVFYPRENNLTVKIGAGKWLDKALAGGVGMLLLWPLAVTASIGAYEQMKLPSKIFAFIQEFSKD